jgi:protein gp37
MSTTKIEYGTNPDGTPGRTWPFMRGCSKTESPGCANCYAEAWARRSGLGFQPTFHPEHLDDPLRAKDTKPLTFLGAFLGDWLHPAITDAQLLQVMDVLRRNEHRSHPHTIIILTKRATRLNRFFRRLRWWSGSSEHPHGRLWLTDEPDDRPSVPVPDVSGATAGHLGRLLPHFWPGVSICVAAEEHKSALLLAAPVRRRILSLEPLLEPVQPVLRLVRTTPDTFPAGAEERIDLVIAGGESGAQARPMHPDWVRRVRDDCQAAEVPFAFKQWGEFLPAFDAGQRSEELDRWSRTFGDAWASGSNHRFDDGQVMVRVGKHRAGRRLDGVEDWSLPWLAGR